MTLTNTPLQPLTATLPQLALGQTVLALGVVPNLSAGVYGVPYQILDIVSASAVFGNGRFLQGIGEVMRQQASSVLAIALSSEADIPQILDAYTDLPFDIVCPIGMFANAGATPVFSRLNTFSNFASVREQCGRPVTVVMSVDTGAGIPGLISAPMASACGTTAVPGIGPSPLGRYFVFCPDTLTINPDVPSSYQADAGPSIAGLAAATAPWTTITNKPLINVDCVPLDTVTGLALADLGYTVLQKTVRRGITPLQGVTGTYAVAGTPFSSPYFHRYSTIRTCHYVEATIRDACREFVGEPAPSNIQDTITTVLDDLVAQGAIITYDLNVTVNAFQGSITIIAAIQVPYETTMISVTSQINLQGLQ